MLRFKSVFMKFEVILNTPRNLDKQVLSLSHTCLSVSFYKMSPCHLCYYCKYYLQHFVLPYRYRLVFRRTWMEQYLLWNIFVPRASTLHRLHDDTHTHNILRISVEICRSI